jgi:hypothetical protein
MHRALHIPLPTLRKIQWTVISKQPASLVSKIFFKTRYIFFFHLEPKKIILERKPRLKREMDTYFLFIDNCRRAMGKGFIEILFTTAQHQMRRIKNEDR